MRRRILLSIVAAALLAALHLGATAPATRAATIVVNPGGGGNFTTIQAAINNATPGDTIAIAPGTYAESLDLSLMGSAIGGTTGNLQLIAGGGAGTVTLGGGGAKIRQSGAFNGALIVDGLRISSTNDDGLRLSAFTGLLVVNSTFDPIGTDNNAHNAVELTVVGGTPTVVVSNSRFVNVANDAIAVAIGGTAQAMLTIVGNTITDDGTNANTTDQAISATVAGGGALDATIRDNTLSQLEGGIFAAADNTARLRASVTGNSLSAILTNTAAIAVQTLAGATTATIDATVADNSVATINGTGILVNLLGTIASASSPRIEAGIVRNTLTGIGDGAGDRGINVTASTNANVGGAGTFLIEGNTLDGSHGSGLRLAAGGTSRFDAVVRNNSFLNTVQTASAIEAGIWLLTDATASSLRAAVTDNTATVATPATNREIKLLQVAGTMLQLEGNAALTPDQNLEAQNPSATGATQTIGTVGMIAPGTATIPSENRVPVAMDDSATVASGAGTTIAVLTNDTDPDGAGDPRQLHSFSFTSQRGGAVARDTNGTPGDLADDRLLYTPPSGLTGTDRFYYTVLDNGRAGDIATVTVTIAAAPVAQATAATTAEDTAVSVTLTATDADSPTLTLAIVASPAHGTVTTPGAATCTPSGGGSTCTISVTYTPTANYSGGDSLTYKANDGQRDSNVATATLTVGAANDAPTAQGGSADTAEEIPVAITLTATDIDSAALTFVVVTGPEHGSLGAIGTPVCTSSGGGTSCTATATYTPAANYGGDDSFTFRANDGGASSNTATVTITVGAVDDPPVAQAASATTTEDTAVSLALTATDADSAALTFVVIAGPTHGTLGALGAPTCATVAGLTTCTATVTYTPTLDYSGGDSLTFEASDGTSDSNTATATVAITPVADAPRADNLSVTTTEGTSQTVTVRAADPDSPALTFAVVAAPAHGTLGAIGAPICTANGGGTICTATVAYTPAAGYTGPDSFTYRASDGALDSDTATATITVSAVNDAPAASAGSATTAEDTAVTLTLSASDPDSATLSIAIIAGPTHGALGTVGTPSCTPNGGGTSCTATVTYTPAADYHGGDTFTFTVSDGILGSNVATVGLTVSAVNDPPLAVADGYAVAEDATLAVSAPGVLGNDSDPEGGVPTAVLVSGPAYAALFTLNADGSFAYTPTADYNGPDSFTYRASDGAADSGAVTVSITVTPVADPPTATGDAYATTEGTPLVVAAPGILGNDGDPDAGTILAAILVAGPTPDQGTLTMNTDGSFGFSPASNFSGTASFTYRASDGTATSTIAAVAITVTPAGAATHTLVVTGTAGGAVTGGGTYPAATVVTATATPAVGYVFVGWTFDGAGGGRFGGAPNGWARSVTVTMDGDHRLLATFAPATPFGDVDPADPAGRAVQELAAREIIRGYRQEACAARGLGDRCFGPGDPVLRAQAAALIVRAFGWGNDPVGPDAFSDLDDVAPELRRAITILAGRGIARGYGDGRYGPHDEVSHIQVVSLVTRAMVAAGYWTQVTEDDGTLYPSVPMTSGHRSDLLTFVRHAGPLPDRPADRNWADWAEAASRGWTAQILWQALDSYFGRDAADGGGFIP